MFQIAKGEYKPVNFPYFSFTDKIELYYNTADLIICHAGAGTVYNLLELKKKIIVVPNLERVDPHQRELACYIEKNNYGMVCWDINKINELILKTQNYKPTIYIKDKFVGTNLLMNILKELYHNNYPKKG
jgi:beta-1,4-N-acetylglucosaminyltransferase